MNSGCIAIADPDFTEYQFRRTRQRVMSKRTQNSTSEEENSVKATDSKGLSEWQFEAEI